MWKGKKKARDLDRLGTSASYVEPGGLHLCMNFTTVDTAGGREAHPERVNMIRAYTPSEARMYGVANFPEYRACRVFGHCHSKSPDPVEISALKSSPPSSLAIRDLLSSRNGMTIMRRLRRMSLDGRWSCSR